MILQESFVNQKVTDEYWNVLSKEKQTVFKLDKNLTPEQVSNIMKFAKEFELKAYLDGREGVIDNNANEILNYQGQIKELTERNNKLAIKLQKYL